MIKILKNIVMITITFIGVQLYCTQFTLKYFPLLFDQPTGAVVKKYIEVQFDTSDTGAKAREKFRQQIEIPADFPFNTQSIIIQQEDGLQFAWPDNLTYEELIRRRIALDNKRKIAHDKAGVNFVPFSEKNIERINYMPTDIVRAMGFLLLEDQPQAAEGAVKKDGE